MNHDMFYCENQSSIAMAQNLVFHALSWHIKVPYHYVQMPIIFRELRKAF